AKPYQAAKDLFDDKACDAVLIATPHYDHTSLGIEALQRGYHVLVEKPISAHKADCERLIAAHTDKRLVFAAMFNQRTDPHYIRLRALVKSGELGEIRRINWIITNWFRSQAYYDSGGWRATWGGEGGGVLLNQCPHNLDLFQWLFGMPDSVRAFASYGRYHAIEVEDDVTAFMQYGNGATAVFIASTGEAPGTNRLEVACDRGRLVLEDGVVRWTRSEVPVSTFCETTPTKFEGPPTWQVTIPVHGNGEQHLGILKNFVAAIRDGVPLIAPAAEGIHSVELANAMLLSSEKNATVTLPMDSGEYEDWLKKKIAESTFKKKVVQSTSAGDDFASSFSKV
ncbi:MAG: Gfo/Idh/MocA family oxidoreductase, partial [Verrucomicrobiia bacterium]